MPATKDGTGTIGSRPISVGPGATDPMHTEGFLVVTKLKKAGGSLVMTIPAAARDMLGLAEGQEMAISVKGTQFIAEPIAMQDKAINLQQLKYALDELVAGYKADAAPTEDERAWIDAPPAGREVC